MPIPQNDRLLSAKKTLLATGKTGQN